MRRQIFILFLAFSLLLSACGSEGGAASSSSASSPQRRTTPLAAPPLRRSLPPPSPWPPIPQPAFTLSSPGTRPISPWPLCCTRGSSLWTASSRPSPCCVRATRSARTGSPGPSPSGPELPSPTALPSPGRRRPRPSRRRWIPPPGTPAACPASSPSGAVRDRWSSPSASLTVPSPFCWTSPLLWGPGAPAWHRPLSAHRQRWKPQPHRPLRLVAGLRLPPGPGDPPGFAHQIGRAGLRLQFRRGQPDRCGSDRKQ